MPESNVDVRMSPIEEYEDHLLTTCGVTRSTSDLFRWHILKFLTARFGDPGKADLGALGAGDFIEYISGLSGQYTPNTRKSAVTALRSFLRWLELNGRCSPQLVNAVPTVSSRKSSGVPVHLSETQLASFLSSLDQRNPAGLRNYAAALCMGRLGLRVGEVVRLRLDDVDWREGVLRINKGKGRRASVLPIPKELGEAIVRYLRHGRPPTTSRFIFIGKYPTTGKPIHSATIRRNIGKAINSVGMDLPHKGTRVLRHTAATHMLQKGATLKEIADVLGHSSIDTTAIYAKVDLPTLRDVAMPWPGVEP